jgi:DNA-binding MarR family transcriptional regulator
MNESRRARVSAEAGEAQAGGSPPAVADPLAPVVDAVLRASRVLVAVAARSLAQLAEDVTLTQYRSLVVLASRGPQTVAALAEELSVTPPTASRLCDRLVRKGLVRRSTDRRDRRQVRVALSESGRRLVDAVTVHRQHEIAELLRSVPPDARRSVVAGLQLLSEAAGEVPEQNWSTGWDL